MEISASIQISNQIVPALQSITSAMNMMVNSFHAVRAADMPANMPQWEFSAPPVYTNSGAERFESEYQAASRMAEQLYEKQRKISEQAFQMRVTPPGMLNDVAAVSVRMQQLFGRVQKLNQIPINLRTDELNNELEGLRAKLGQAEGVQKSLSRAMSQMDISAVNAAYQQLNTVMDEAERGIRDNLTVQEQFNQSLNNGSTISGKLGSSIKKFAADHLNKQTMYDVLGLADGVTQTNAKLGLMNNGTDTTEQLQQKIFESSQNSRSSYQTTVGAVTAMGTQAGGAFSSNDELIAFTEQINKSFVIAGTGTQEMGSVMDQIVESMASGTMQGEQFSAVLNNAKPIAQNIADYMGIPVEKVGEMAAEGSVTAEVIKNAMFSAVDETSSRFDQIPVTFGQVAAGIRDQALMAFQPALQQLSSITGTEGFQALAAGIISIMQTVSEAVTYVLNLLGKAMAFLDNGPLVTSILYGMAAAALVYAAALGIQTAATWIASGAAKEFFLALLSNPLTWIVLLIGVAVAAIYRWVQSVGGLKVAWLICADAVLSCAEKVELGFWNMVMKIQNAIDFAELGFLALKTAILNTLGDIKVKGLLLISNFINGLIDYINQLIHVVNSIGVISIDTIQHVEFGTDTALEEKMKQEKRAQELSSATEQVSADIEARRIEYEQRQASVEESRAKRQAEIEAAREEAERKKQENNAPATGYEPEMSTVADNTGNTAANTAAMANTMDLMDEDLKYMRDAAEQEIINRFTLAELKVDVSNSNTLATKMDFDDVNRQLAAATGEILATAAEGGYI